MRCFSEQQRRCPFHSSGCTCGAGGIWCERVQDEDIIQVPDSIYIRAAAGRDICRVGGNMGTFKGCRVGGNMGIFKGCRVEGNMGIF